MEDPRTEIADVVRGLVTRPTLEQQAAVLRKYFSPNVTFYHYYIDTHGLDELTAIYQFAETALNYQRVNFELIAYDDKTDTITLHMKVIVRPPVRLWFEAELEFITLLELEDYEPDENGLNKAASRRKLKRIKIQRDFFQRSPILCIMPVIGDLYSWDKLRFAIGFFQSLAFRLTRMAMSALLPDYAIRLILAMMKDRPL